MVIVFVLTALVLTAAPASAQWRPVVTSCASFAPVSGCDTLPQFDNAWNAVVSPDGKTAYVSAWGAHAIRVFDRNQLTGALTVKAGEDGCIKEGPEIPGVCAGGRGITNPDEILVSADGKNVYVTSWAVPTAAAIAIFNRNTSTGVLTQKAGQDGCINDNATDGCFDGRAVGGQGAVLSPDQNNVYVLGQTTLAVFKRTAADGTLHQLDGMDGCFGTSAGDGCTPTVFNPCCRQMAITSDGKNVYSPQAFGGVFIFNRNATSGALALAPGDQGCVGHTGNAMCKEVPAIGTDSEALTLSRDDKFLYLSHEKGIVTFARHADGTLAFASCLNDTGTLGCARSSNITDLAYMAVSPDNADLVVVHSGPPKGLTGFARNQATGALVRRPGFDGCISPDGADAENGASVPDACRADARVGTHGHVHFFGDGQMYAGFFDEGRIALIKRDFYAVCDSRTVSARHGAATAVPLTCSDRNGDVVTRVIVQLPGAGTLGAVDRNGNVFYSPLASFAGTDHFAYSGISAGLQGPVATVAVTVPRGPKPKPKRIRGITLAYTFDAFTDHTVLTTLAVKGVPRRSTVRVVCRCGGKARTFKKKHARGTVKLKRFVGRSLPAGSHLAITVTKPHTIGAAKLMTIRRHAAPKVATRCLKPGSKKLRTRC
jgi:DNA-binding beta-propeller fold protein YncE